MARFALVKAGVIVNVIEASPEFFASADPAWRSQFDRWVEVVAPGETAATTDPIITRDAEPNATIVGRVVTRAVRSPEPDRVAELEARIAALEASRTR